MSASQIIGSAEVHAAIGRLAAAITARHPDPRGLVLLGIANGGIELARRSEHGYKHSAIIHSLNVDHMTQMARALDTTLFVKNGPCVAGLGLGGEGYLSYSIATTTGEGITTPTTFTRTRRCVMVDNLRIY